MVVLSDPSIAADVAANVQDGSVTDSGALAILDDAASGGMTASKLSSLQAFAAELNVAGGINTSSYVQQILDDVVFENSANSTWNGGAATAAPLGDISATSTQTEVDELIGEWFLGTNLPSLNLASVGGDNLNPTYQNSTLPLYGPSGAPAFEDVNQGNLGDCYFLASLGEVALTDPAAIENMISSNGNGTYSVRFFVDGEPDYVTVNSELPVMSGYQWANGSTLEFANGATDDWVALVEKAYAQLNAQTDAPHGATLDSASDSYAGITGGDGSALTLITDQSETQASLAPWDSSSDLTSLMSSLAASWRAGEEILMSTPENSNGNLVGDHMFMITAIDASTCSLTIQNPWGSADSGALAMNFTETLQELADDECSLWVTTGSADATPTPTTIATNGETTLAEVENLFELNPAGVGTGPLLHINGSLVTAGEFAAGWTPVGAVETAAGYEVAWSVPGKNEYVVWNVDSNGDFTGSDTGILSGKSDALQQVELNFGEAFAGAEAPTPTTIAANGVTTLARVANEFELKSAGGGTGPFLEINGSPVMAGQFALGWAPVGAVQTASGYEVAWSVPGQNEYVVWDVNSNGAYTSAATGILMGASAELEGVEANFGENFAGAGAAAAPTAIATSGPTTLAVVGDLFELNPAGGGRGPLLQLDGAVVAAGQFALGWTPIEAEKTSTGYQVEWSVPGQHEYTIWNVNSSGGFTGDSTGVVSGDSSALQSFNPSLSADLNDGGRLSSPAGSLEAYDAIAGGAHAAAFASVADSAHGLALTGVSSSLTAADLWAAHTAFSGGHALMA